MAKIQLSRKRRRVFVKTPGGSVHMHFVKRKPAKAHCADCGRELPGVLAERPYRMQNTAKTKKRPQRPYGGNLCSACSRKRIAAKAMQ